jgi:deazaflavin-dependent oxidoreductase (nitroreductase family)
LHYLDRALLRLSKGRLSLPGPLTGLPIVMLTTVGARSGKARTTPLVAIRDGANMILIASYFGNRHHPAWYYNLRAHPQVTLTVDGGSAPYVAREAGDAERETYWRKAVALYKGYAAYKERAQGRKIPIVILSKEV